MKKTPVIVVAYNRADVLSLALDRLSECNHVMDRDIFLYIDGARRTEDIADVAAVVKLGELFKNGRLQNLTIIKREKNFGCRDNIVQAVNEVLKKYGTMCLIEDDVLVSHTFLDYMDSALAFYESDHRIFNINAYQQRYLKVPHQYKNDVYLDLRNHTPGWGIWLDRWERVDFDLRDFDTYVATQDHVEKILQAGYDLLRMLVSQAHNPSKLNAWDLQCTYHMVKHGMFSIEPRYSLTKNIGFGMKSEHCLSYNPTMPTQPFYDFLPELVPDIEPFEDITKQFRFAAVDVRLFSRIRRRIDRMFWRHCPIETEPRPVD